MIADNCEIQPTPGELEHASMHTLTEPCPIQYSLPQSYFPSHLVSSNSSLQIAHTCSSPCLQHPKHNLTAPWQLHTTQTQPANFALASNAGASSASIAAAFLLRCLPRIRLVPAAQSLRSSATRRCCHIKGRRPHPLDSGD